MNNKHFALTILEWYEQNKRDLPWRNTSEPYIIWLSEVILQQTRVAQGLPYFEKFLENFPKVEDLAQAPSDEVMRLWQGLGYYSRARNLHQCAKDIVEEHNGKFPNNYNSLIKLKGVGSYTAAAIASFAFNEPVAVVDGNVFRVLARYFGISTDIASNSGKKEFEIIANECIPNDKPAAFNQAIMEFGSLQCAPKNPKCEDCPLRGSCFAFKNELTAQLPVKINKVKVRKRYFTYFYIKCAEEVVVNYRSAGDIWQGLYDFPLHEVAQKPLLELNEASIFQSLTQFDPEIHFDSATIFKHILTHQRIFANFVTLIIQEKHRKNLHDWAKNSNYELIHQDKLDSVGKPRLLLKFLNDEK
ncbi:A/G-specific DNA-adenine glycosylase [Belliella baltica DSM 15883]|uniref:Adenine DNA glycosylase n=1 Tax=Belliella baltica (strain DSM 15883 / CIP 108006 / LMG 21964 / BA134) TaxID=866536 RepID=I3Z3D4_BELBD|nr:A/G-specific adenine glycosylase [Belliella baltica]AFL83752.1 A/G-specific DNA-adenine glycosylase [Belliella baltica DSM 15883]